MRNRPTLVESDEGTGVDMSPLIDMVFILLIFFIVTTTFVQEAGVEVNKPQAASAASLDKNSIIFAVTEQGQVVYGGKEISLGAVRPLVKRLSPENNPMPVIIQADKNARMGITTRVLDEATLGGAKNVSIATEQGQ
jgi:biopolymer transport protein ExbD